MTPRMKAGTAGVALILATNAIAIGGALYNRGGEPESRLVLGERELSVPYAWGWRKENSGLSLRLRWRVARLTSDDEDLYEFREADWLDAGKLAALGFDTSLSPDAPEASRLYDRQLDHDAFLVLEQDGPARAAALQASQRRLAEAEVQAAKAPDAKATKEALEWAKKVLHREQHVLSRLFVVDAGPDLQALRHEHPDATRYAIVRGHVSIGTCMHESRRFVCGHIADLEVPEINVPLALQSAFDGAQPDEDSPARYAAEIAFGRRLEPWVVSAERLK